MSTSQASLSTQVIGFVTELIMMHKHCRAKGKTEPQASCRIEMEMRRYSLAAVMSLIGVNKKNRVSSGSIKPSKISGESKLPPGFLFNSTTHITSILNPSKQP